MDHRSLLILSGQILLSITIIASTLIATNTFKKIKIGQGKINVKGCAEKEIKSDFVKWQGEISASDQNQMKAYEMLEKDLAILQDYLSKRSIPLEEMSFSPVVITQINKINSNGHSTNEAETYILSRNFSIAVKDVDLIKKTSEEVTSLIKDGITIKSYPPEFYYKKLDELKISMLREAAIDARQRAEELVYESRSSVGPLRTAQQGVFQITPAYSTLVSDYGEYDTTSIDKRIKAVVTMEYAID